MSNTEAEAFDKAGYIAMKQGHYEEAVVLFTKAIEKDPTNGVYYTDRCAAYLAIGKSDKAIEDGKKGVELSPDNPTCNMQLGIIYDALHEWAKGLELHEKALALQPNNEQMWAFVRHDRIRLSKRGENKAAGLEFLEFLDAKGGQAAFLTRSPELYHFIDDITENLQHAVNYLGNPIMDLFAEHMMGGIIPPEIGARRVPVAKVKAEFEEEMKKIEEKRKEGN